jgi:flagellar basal-body rod modification protein FlgD
MVPVRTIDKQDGGEMAGIAGIWNHTTGALSALGKANPMDSTQGASGSSAGEASTISANDFLTLLVTEMKNQDPTANTDPNAYINQLVGVNSLEQLININQNLSTALGDSGGVSGGSIAGRGMSSPVAVKSGATAATPAAAARQTAAKTGASSEAISHSKTVPVVAGNLGAPRTIPAAHRVAEALSGHK